MVDPQKARVSLGVAGLLVFVLTFAVEQAEAGCLLDGANCIPATSGNTGKKGNDQPQCCIPSTCAAYSKTYIGKGKYSYQYKCAQSGPCTVTTNVNNVGVNSFDGILKLRLQTTVPPPSAEAKSEPNVRCIATNDPAMVSNLLTYQLLFTNSATTPAACTSTSCQGAQTSVLSGVVDSLGNIDISSPINSMHSEGLATANLAPPVQIACMILPPIGPSMCSGAPTPTTLIVPLSPTSV